MLSSFSLEYLRESILSLILGLILLSPRDVNAGLRFDSEAVDYAGWMDPRFSEESLKKYQMSQSDYEKVVAIKRYIEKRVAQQIEVYGTFNMSADPYVKYYSQQMDHVLKNYQRGFFDLDHSQKMAMSWLKGFFRLFSKPTKQQKPVSVGLGIRG
jgi:hypothetical protein